MLIKKLCKRMIWLWHYKILKTLTVKNDVILKNYVETSLTKTKLQYSSKTKDQADLQLQKNLKLDFILYGLVLEFQGKNKSIHSAKTNAGCIC